MRPTIKNKLYAGFGAVLVLMGIVAAIATHSVLGLRTSALETARVGDRLDSISLEIQVHNLEAQRKVKSYLADSQLPGTQETEETNISEAQFEIHEIETLAAKAVHLAPTPEGKAKFQVTLEAAKAYAASLATVVQEATKGATDAATAAPSSPAKVPSGTPIPPSTVSAASLVTYEAAALHLSESAEDGELAGRDASQTSQHNVERISQQSVPLVVGISLVALFVALVVSFSLSRAILIPVQHLGTVAENVSMGNLQISVHRFSNDEIGDLADSFSRMVTAVRFFQSEVEASKTDAAQAALAKGASAQ